MSPGDNLLAEALNAGAGADRLPHPRPTADAAKARHVATEFEAVFLSQMFDAMYAGIGTDGPFNGGAAERIYRSMLNQEYAAVMARNGGVGIADAVYAEILKLQEVP